MKPLVNIAGAAVAALALISVAHAAPTPNSSSNTPTTNSGATKKPMSNASIQAAQTQFMHDLKDDGFTDIKIMPESFLVRAKDKHGRPIMMVLNPDSVTEVIGPKQVSANKSASQGSSKPNANPSTSSGQ